MQHIMITYTPAFCTEPGESTERSVTSEPSAQSCGPIEVRSQSQSVANLRPFAIQPAMPVSSERRYQGDQCRRNKQRRQQVAHRYGFDL